jgi:PAS domain S-box-containing protein
MLLILEYLDLIFVFISLLIIGFVVRKRLRKDAESGKKKSDDSFWEASSSCFFQWGGISVAVVLIFAGWFITQDLSQKQEEYMVQELRTQTNKLVHSFHPQHIDELTFTSRDKDKPVYHRIKSQLRNYASIAGLDGIYTVKKRGKNYFFGPESYMPGDPMHAPPGTKYFNPPTELREVFSRLGTVVTKPYKDEYGHFVSCFSSLMSFDGKEVLMAVGVDVPVSEWSYHKNVVKILPLSITLVLLLLVLAGFSYARRKKQKNSFFHSQAIRYSEGLFVLIAGLIISLYIAKISYDEDERYKRAIFSQSATSETRALTRSFDMVKHSLTGMSRLFSVSENVTEAEFTEYVKRIVEYPFIVSAGWIEQISKRGFYSRYGYPSGRTSIPLGEYKASLDSLRLGAILETLYSGFISATNSYYVGKKRMVDVFMATRNAEGEINGIVTMTLDMDALVNSLVNSSAVYADYYTISLKQINTAQFSTSQKKSDFLDILLEKDDMVSYDFLDFFFGKVFSISVMAGPGFYGLFGESAFWTPFIVGMLITLLITAFILVMINRRLILERQIEKHVANLEISEERFKSLFSNMLEGVAFHQMIFNDAKVPVNYKVVAVNKAFEKLLGLKAKDVIGKDAKEAYTEIPLYFDKYIEVVRDKKAFVFETYSEKLDKYFEISVAPWGENGFATIFSDVSKRREAEKQLKKSEEKYRLISENAGDLIWLYDPADEKFTYVSPSVKKLTGFSYNELLGKSMGFILDESSYADVKSRLPLRLARFSIGEEMMRVEKSQLRIRTKFGNTVPIEVMTTLMLNKKNEVTEILGVGREIRDRLAAEAALKESEEKYRLLVENQSDLVVKVDREGYLLYVSPSYCRLFAKNEDELLNKKFMPLVHPDDRAATEEAMKRLFAPPHRVVLEQRAMTKDGWKWLAWSDTAVFDDNGEMVEIIGVGRDVTERKMAENALQESREMLERQNEEYATLNEEYLTMNEELTSINEDLSTAIERAEESEKLKTAFLQNMSHEIRTPLNSIIGFSEMLGIDFLTEDDRKDFTTIIVNSSKQLLDLVNDILTISAIETRQDKVNPEPVNISDLTSELYSVFRPKAKEKGISLKLKKPNIDGMATLVTDELKLKQVLINLLGNALKFTEEGYIEYGYELRNESDFVFHVKDTGIGIPPKMQDRIFDRFMQADNSTKGQYGGTGLGLAICKGHVEMLGGEIWLDSTPGVGSAFYFSLPVFKEVDI